MCRNLREDRVVLGGERLVEDDLEVVRRDGLEVLGADVAAVGARDGLVEDADRGVHARAVHGVAHRARVREEGHGHAALDVLLEDVAGLVRHLVVEVAAHDLRDLEELVDLVVREVDVVADARRHARDEGEELVHAVLVARQHHDQILAVVLHEGQEDLDGLLAVVAVVRRVVEVVGLVY